jgi:hypothetical protein
MTRPVILLLLRVYLLLRNAFTEPYSCNDRGDTHTDTHLGLFWLQCSGFQALGGETQQGNLISLFPFFF